MTPDFIAPDRRDGDEIDTAELGDLDDDGSEPTRRVRTYDGLTVDTGADPGTIGADANGA